MSNLSSFPQNFFTDFLTEPSSFGYFIKPLHGMGFKHDFEVDIKEHDGSYLVHAELPGVNKHDLQVGINADRLTISAEIKQHDEKKDEGKTVRSERYFGAVSRSFQLPTEIDESTSSAKYENGILELVLKKRTPKNTKRIEIK